jgi:RNA polymerase sigma-70 factor (ECF subfamily)
MGRTQQLSDTAEHTVPTPRTDPEQADVDAAALAERITRGDVAALAEVYGQTSSLVFTIALRALASHADAEDVTQCVYLQAWRSRAAYDPSRWPVRGWLVGIARQLIADKLAEPARQIRLEQPFEEFGAAERETEVSIAERIADAIVVVDSLSRLVRPRRDVVEMSFFDGLTHTQISEALNLPLGSVKSHITGGLSQLRRQMAVSDGAS